MNSVKLGCSSGREGVTIQIGRRRRQGRESALSCAHAALTPGSTWRMAGKTNHRKECECPALGTSSCPHINHIRYLHALNIGLDANFRLKRKDVSSDQADPGLSHGWSYFVEETGFKAYLEPHASETEPKSTCSQHDTVNLVDTRPGQGYKATGVGTVECTRHNMKRPSAIGDLQQGERYVLYVLLIFKSHSHPPAIATWTTSCSRASQNIH